MSKSWKEEILARFDEKFTRTDKSPENRGYMENWFIKDTVTPKELKQFISETIDEREKEFLLMLDRISDSLGGEFSKEERYNLIQNLRKSLTT